MANSYEWTYPQLDRVATEGDKSDVVKTGAAVKAEAEAAAAAMSGDG